MIISDPIKIIENAALEAGLRLEEVFNESDVAFSNHSRWKNNITSPNHSTILKLQSGLESLIKKKSKRKKN
jgi:hypothetical protein